MVSRNIYIDYLYNQAGNQTSTYDWLEKSKNIKMKHCNDVTKQIAERPVPI